jgi:hypothetical protein
MVRRKKELPAYWLTKKRGEEIRRSVLIRGVDYHALASRSVVTRVISHSPSAPCLSNTGSGIVLESFTCALQLLH